MKAPDSVPLDREEQIAYILGRLSTLPREENTSYALEQNRTFFKAARSLVRYIPWLVRSGNIDHTQLLEINELLPEVDRAFHAKLLEIERQPFPGMVRGIVEYLVQQTSSTHDRIRIASLGSGALEAERQFIDAYLTQHATGKLTLVGFDLASGAHDMAHENISALGTTDITVVRVNTLDKNTLTSEEGKCTTRVLVLLATNDIFELEKNFDRNTFDILISVLFLHHLSLERGRIIVQLMRSLASRVAVYDGYRTFPHRVIQSIVGWGHPIFMNAAVFSNLRFLARPAVLNEHTEAAVTFYRHGHYRATYKV